MEMKSEYTILVPNMAPIHFGLLRNVFVNRGYKMEILQNSGRAVVDAGLKYVHNDICYPCQLVIGQFLDALAGGGYDPHKVALMITQTGGGCRASNYIYLLRKALEKAGYGYVPVISLSMAGLEKNSGFRITLPVLRMAIAALAYGDLLMSLDNQTKPYEKPISAELAALIRKAIAYTKERYGDVPYIFVDKKNPSRPMQYTTVQIRITNMIYKKDLRDDNGEIFGFGSHLYRHYYGMKLTEMHLDDWTIAKLLGHSSVKNVKYYRKMSNQLLADETRKARQRLSAVILDNLDGWEAEYAQIRQNDRLQ